jgi:hypothetical protein
VDGILKEKYVNKGYSWFLIDNGSERVYVNVVKPEVFAKAIIDQKITLTNCFRLASRKWKKVRSR